jgi:hypothetical protein
MNKFRDILINQVPFMEFEIYCAECGDVLVDIDDYITGSPLKNEVLILHRIREHTIANEHYEFTAKIDPARTIEEIDSTIIVNEDV